MYVIRRSSLPSDNGITTTHRHVVTTVLFSSTILSFAKQFTIHTLLDVVLSLSLALVFGTLFLPTSLQHLLCSYHTIPYSFNNVADMRNVQQIHIEIEMK